MIPRYSLTIPASALRGISKVLRSGYLTSGPAARQFEAKFAKYVGTKYAVAVCNGTAALHLALLAVGVESGSEVILPSFTYHAAAAAVVYCNARPVLVDVEPTTMCIDPESIREAIGSKTRAIIPTHLAGHPCDMKRIQEIAKDNGLAVIEDAAHATGARYYNTPVGSLGEAGCFSFYPTKPLTTGEGGMITTNDPHIASKARILRSLATERSRGLHYDVRSIGFTYRMSELQAALGLHQLARLDRTNSVVRKKADILVRKLGRVNGLVLPYEAPYARHVYSLFVVQILARKFGLHRDDVAAALRRKGIETQLHYVPVHRLTFFAHAAKFTKRKLKVSDSLWKRVLSLPLSPRIRDRELDRVSDALLSCGVG